MSKEEFTHEHHDHATHKSHLDRLKRIEGQVRGVAKMVEDERYCLDIITQIKAIKSALASVEKKITEDHLNHCLKRAVKSKEESEAQRAVEEIMTLLKGR